MKVSHLQAFNLVHKFDIICVSKAHLDSSISKDVNVISTEGYSIIQADHPNNTKGAGVCIYYNKGISVRQRRNMSLSDWLACEIVIGKKKGYVITLYRPPSQNQGNFEHFLFSPLNLLGKINYWVTLMSGLRIGGFTA